MFLIQSKWGPIPLVLFCILHISLSPSPSLAAPCASSRLLVRYTDDGTARFSATTHAKLGTRSVGFLPKIALEIVETLEPQNLDELVAKYQNYPQVAYIETDGCSELSGVPDDYHFEDQWALAAIDAPRAWELNTGSNILVAIIDTGVDYNHPDLAANIWTNTGEIPANGIDDDQNGYIDDVHGYDFYARSADPQDPHGHGTVIAGIIGAVGNNGQGVTGINWQVRIMPLKFTNARGGGTSSATVEAIDYAIAMGAKIINYSHKLSYYSKAVDQAIARAQNAGVLFVTSAHNNGQDIDRNPIYPSAYEHPNIISVSATDEADNKYGPANYGQRTVDLAAPGAHILSTIPGQSYSSWSGTSFAAPYVAGVAALLLAQRPDLGPLAVRQHLLDTVDPLPNLKGMVSTGGRLNAHKALNSIQRGRDAQLFSSAVIQAQPSRDGQRDQVRLFVKDPDLNLSTEQSDNTSIWLYNTATGLIKTVYLEEIGTNSGTFVAAVPTHLRGVSPPDPNTLAVAPGDTLISYFRDEHTLGAKQIVHSDTTYVVNMFGDMNGDGRVEFLDAQLLMWFSLAHQRKTHQGDLSGDVDGSSALRPHDASLVLKYALGRIRRFPIQDVMPGTLELPAAKAQAPGSLHLLQPERQEDGTWKIGLSLAQIGDILSGSATFNFSTDIELISLDQPRDSGVLIAHYQSSDSSLSLAFANDGQIPLAMGELIWIHLRAKEGTHVELTEARINDMPLAGENPILALQPALPQDHLGLGNAPNPFNPSTHLYFNLETDTPVHLAIYNASGQQIRTLALGTKPEGTHQIQWDGRDENGLAVASGMYLARLRAGSQQRIHKMTLVR